MNFETWLASKKIDAEAFKTAETQLFNEWKAAFEQMHVQSFTVQKLNLINPLRRKYRLKAAEPSTPDPTVPEAPLPKPAAKPMMKPKPRIN